MPPKSQERTGNIWQPRLQVLAEPEILRRMDLCALHEIFVSSSDAFQSLRTSTKLRHAAAESKCDPRKQHKYACNCLDWNPSEKCHLESTSVLVNAKILLKRLQDEILRFTFSNSSSALPNFSKQNNHSGHADEGCITNNISDVSQKHSVHDKNKVYLFILRPELQLFILQMLIL